MTHYNGFYLAMVTTKSAHNEILRFRVTEVAKTEQVFSYMSYYLVYTLKLVIIFLLNSTKNVVVVDLPLLFLGMEAWREQQSRFTPST